ncbi:MAG TPA: exosortase-associated EpsI family protein [Candidatus Limnocylindrales bacterium]|jgi:hypothetical protein|nr:exosortase-associated EpsI family protein [Candidatus Limnocylindrales bacterium]
MSKQKSICFLATLLLMAGAAGLLMQARIHQKLGLPGIKTHSLAGSIRLQADLPERVLDYTSEEKNVDDITLGTLPPDTSFGQRKYVSADGFRLDLSVVLMGADRTSLHKPQFCLPGQGLQIDDARSAETTIHVERPISYDLPVVKLFVRTDKVNGQPMKFSGVYVYWYVCDDGVSATLSGFQRMWWSAKKLLRTGVLQRWAYVNCWATCPPGQEDATFERMKKFIAASVPEFQLLPKPPVTSLTARQ